MSRAILELSSLIQHNRDMAEEMKNNPAIAQGGISAEYFYTRMAEAYEYALELIRQEERK